MALNLEGLVVGDGELQIPALDFVKEVGTQLVVDVHRFVDALSATAIEAVVIAQLEANPSARNIGTRTRSESIDRCKVGVGE